MNLIVRTHCLLTTAPVATTPYLCHTSQPTTGFLNMKMKPVYRRLLTRAVAVVPALVVAAALGDKAVGQLLVISQVVLSMQLPFAVFPLVQFTSRRKFTGRYANGYITATLAGLAALLIAGLNVYLLISIMRDPKALTGGDE